MSIATGKKTDLDCINNVVAAAVMSWPMPERIKRLSVPVLSYDSEDFKHYRFVVYRQGGEIKGVAAWNPEAPLVTELGTGRLLHGLYISPDCQGRGYGRDLMAAVLCEAMTLGAEGLVIKAERPSIGFFEHCGLQPLSATGATDYPYQFWYQARA
ncbi:GNAT family N-acetyltransferase [Porticoccaceae bacterium]|nr:GNAT family N-acetyltransferase [Porticoccaceae bacterium]